MAEIVPEMRKEEFGKSLSTNDHEIFKYLPYLLQDLWELGGRPDIQLSLIKTLNLRDIKILDLGCGKGSSLIKILKYQTGKGVGVDIVEEFVGEAKNKSIEWEIDDRIVFRAEDLVKTLKTEKNYDIVLYGIDSNILGTIEECFRSLKPVLNKGGYVIAETIYPKTEMDDSIISQKEFQRQVQKAGFVLLEEKFWGIEDVKSMNQEYTAKIVTRAQELIAKYPWKKVMFEQYVNSQIEECKELENDLYCVSVLCQLKS